MKFKGRVSSIVAASLLLIGFTNIVALAQAVEHTVVFPLHDTTTE